MFSVSSLLMMLGVILLLALVIITLARLLGGHRRNTHQVHILADPTQYPWNAKHGPWYFGNWGVNARIIEAISEGRRRRYPGGSHRKQARRHKR
jgi:NADH:ubiquinone oxidoreductase subunit 3 (subunit A)